MTISEIAKQRNLAESTVINHLAKMVEIGILKIERFANTDEQKTALELYKNLQPNESFFGALNVVFNSQKTAFLSAWIRGGQKDGKV